MKLIFGLMFLFGVAGFALGLIVYVGQMNLALAIFASGKIFATTGAALGGVLGYYLQK